MISNKLYQSISIILLISCTAIGGGILALPIQTFSTGFLASSVIFLISWIFMTISALYLVEVCSKTRSRNNLISLAEETLGKKAKIISAGIYLALLYSLISAYITASSFWLLKANPDLSSKQISIAIFLSMGIITYYGAQILNKINLILSLVLFTSLFIIIFTTIPNCSSQMLSFTVDNFSEGYKHFPLIITAFGFAIIIPALFNNFSFDATKISKLIKIGSLLPLTIYILWQAAIHGTIYNQYAHTNLNASTGTEAIELVSSAVNNPYMTTILQIFTLSAILTSLLGVMLSLSDFLFSISKWQHTVKNKLFVVLLACLPGLLITNISPNSFSSILSFGGIFVAILVGIIPALMAMKIRKANNAKYGYTVSCGTTLIIINIIFFLLVIVIECLNLTT